MSALFQPAARTAGMNPSAIREILKSSERPGVLSLAGGLPSPDSFPVDAIRAATERVLRDTPREALQYAASEGHGPLREWIAGQLRAQGLQVDAAGVLVTNGSQQGLDLIGRLLIDPGSTVAVESPTYLGALQAFAPCEPRFAALAGDDDGPLPDALRAAARAPAGQGESGVSAGKAKSGEAAGLADPSGPTGPTGPSIAPARFAYLQPNFQNPTGRLMGDARRQAIVAAAAAVGLPLVEDDPYGALWFDAPPPAPLAARWPEGTVYLGSFSKVLAPGLRLGYIVAPPALRAKLLQAKQAADLHTPGFNQRIAFEVVKDGLLDRHLPAVRARYAVQRDAMAAALRAHLPAGCTWRTPQGGMFVWLRLPAGLDASALLPHALAAGVAYVPGAPFYSGPADVRTLRLSFVTLPPAQIAQAVAALGRVLHAALDAAPVGAAAA